MTHVIAFPLKRAKVLFHCNSYVTVAGKRKTKERQRTLSLQILLM